MNDTFPHLARWDSVGLDCSSCKHFAGPLSWPDTARTSHCTFHQTSLTLELDNNGYKLGEWFCREFSDNGMSHQSAVVHFAKIYSELSPQVFYAFRAYRGLLDEVSLATLPRAAA
jgi:hypothetical protein